jgi:3-dehydroshikimate dehydratase
MISPGLVSVTYRQLSVEQIIAHSVAAKLKGIEWGGDIHVPHGQLDHAAEVGRKTREAGLQISAYGSYYRAGHDAELAAEIVVATAQKLGAPLIRIWAGKLGSATADAAYKDGVAHDCRKLSSLAAEQGLKVALEWHGNTLTDTAPATADLIAAVNHPNLYTYWQPRLKTSVAENLAEMTTALPYLAGVHVFNWDAVTGDRYALAAGSAAWREYLAQLPDSSDFFASLEFVPNNDPAVLTREAAALRGWLDSR